MTTTYDYEPRAWVGCLGCYNAGRLNGQWHDDETIDLISNGQAMKNLANVLVCRTCFADEFWVMDSEYVGAGEMSIPEFERRAAAVAAVQPRERRLFIAWADDRNTWDAEQWQQALIGVTEDLEESDEDLVAEFYAADLNEGLNYEQFGTWADRMRDAYTAMIARDLVDGGEIDIYREDGMVAILLP